MSGSPDHPSSTDSLATVEQDPSLRFNVADATVAATRYERIDGEGPSPAVLWYTPYHKDDETTFGRYDPLLEYIAAHGYEVVVADMIGTGASTGHRTAFLGPDTGSEVAELITAIADRPWTTDRVGMIGKSFPGAVCLAAGAAAPEELAAIVPILTTHRRERFGFNPGGLAYLWQRVSVLALYLASGVQPPSRRPEGWEALWHDRLERFREEGPPLELGLDPDPEDPYWQWTVPVADIEVPTFAVGGYRDYFPTDTIEYFEAINAPKRLLMGPWRHVSPYQGRETAVGFRGQVVDWLDRFLKDASVDPLDYPISYWTQRAGGRAIDAGQWRGRERWPTTAHAESLSFAATPDGLQRGDGPRDGGVERSVPVDYTVGLEAQDIAVEFVDTNADDARSLTFETDSLDQPIGLTGTGKATVHLDTNGTIPLSVRLVDVAPDGRARPITKGSVLVEDPVSQSVTVPLRPVSHLIEVDHGLRMAISLADFPTHRPIGATDSVTVTSSPDRPTLVEVPGHVGSGEPFEDDVSLRDPDHSVPLRPPANRAANASWTTSREHERGRATRRREVQTEFVFPHVEKTYTLDIEASVTHDDPSEFFASTTIESTLHHDNQPVTVEATVREDATESAMRAVVRRDESVVFEEEWCVGLRSRLDSG